MSKLNKEAKETLRSARALADANILQAKSEVLATIAPQIKEIIEEEIQREINKSMNEKFNDIEDLENPIPEPEEEFLDDEEGEEDVEDEEFDIDDDLGSPPESSDEIENGNTEKISVEIDGAEYSGDYSPGDETIELQLVGSEDELNSMEGGEEEDLGLEDEPIVTDSDEFGEDEDEDLNIELEDEEDEEFEDERKIREAVRKIIRDKKTSLNDIKRVSKPINKNLQENKIRQITREILLEKLGNKQTTPKKPQRKSLTIEEKLKNKGLIPEKNTSNKGNLFENDEQRKEVYDRLIHLMGD